MSSKAILCILFKVARSDKYFVFDQGSKVGTYKSETLKDCGEFREGITDYECGFFQVGAHKDVSLNLLISFEAKIRKIPQIAIAFCSKSSHVKRLNSSEGNADKLIMRYCKFSQ